MSSRREKLLQKLNPKLLEKTPKLSLGSDSFIHLDSRNEDDTLHEGAKELMVRFFNKHESVFNKSTIDNVDLSDSKYQDCYRFCQSISKRLSLPFAKEEEFKFERPGKKLQDLKRKLEEKMSIKRKQEYHKRVEEYKKWKNEINNKKKNLDENDLSDECSDKEAEKVGCHNEKQNVTESVQEENGIKLGDESAGGNNIIINVNDNDNDDNDNDDDDDYCDYDGVSDDGNEGDCDDGSDDDNDEGSNDSNDRLNNIRLGEHLQTEEIGDEKKEIKTHINKSNISLGANLIHNENTPELNDEINKNPNEDEENDDDKYSLLPPYQPGGGLTCSTVEQTQYSQDILPNLLSPSLNLVLMAESQSPKSKNVSPVKDNGLSEASTIPFKSKNMLFSSIQDLSQHFDLNDALEFCSGNFPTDTSQRSPSNRRHLSHNFDKENSTRNSFKYKRRIIAYGDDSEDETINKADTVDEKGEENHMQITSDAEEDSGNQVKAMKKGARQILHFSDDEEDDEPFNHVSISEKYDDDDDDDHDEDRKGGSDPEEDEDRRSVYYDSEENEITNPKDFFEKEAELSGSEFSVDEDEKGLDEFDEEAGDADVLDLNEIHSQLGKIHLRRLLDDDSRNVRFLQELFFEDGDLHTDKEYKKFKWRNPAQLKEDQPMEGEDGRTNEVNAESSDEEGAEDMEARKERLKRQLLLGNAQQNVNDLTSGCDLFKNALRRLKVTTVKNELKVSGANLGDLTDPPSSVVSWNTGRGSFLKRNEELLSKLAKTITSVDNVRGPKNSKNFVFATRSPDKETSEIKRPRQESEIQHQKKRLKLHSDISVPSILDLLE